MGKRVKILSITAMFIQYCFFISIYCGTVMTTSCHSSNILTHENFAPAIFTNGDNHAEQAESSSNAYTNIPRTPLKDSFNQFSFSPLATLGVLNNPCVFSLYILYSRNLFIRFSNTNIIFPFHNFW